MFALIGLPVIFRAERIFTRWDIAYCKLWIGRFAII